MKKYFIVKELYSVIMVDIESMEENKDVVIYNIHDDKSTYFHRIKYGSFARVIKPHINNDGYEIHIFKPLEKGFQLTENYLNHDGNSTFTYTEKMILLDDEAKYILEFEDDDAAELWIETYGKEYIND